MNQTPYNPASKQPKSSNCIQDSVFWIYTGMMLLYGIIMLSVSTSSVTELNLLLDSEAYGFSQDTLQVWNLNFIIDIQTAEAGCPQGYEELLNYEWPGTIQGCNCPYTIQKSKQNFIVKGKCNSELLSYNCLDLDPIDPLYMRVWKNSKKLCLLRDVYSFVNSPLQNCESKIPGYKMCGDGQYAICTRNTTNCPITTVSNTAIIVSSTSVGEPLTITTNLTYYYQSESINLFPISQFILEEYDFCADPNRENISPDQKGDYILLRERRTTCTNIDPRVIDLDTIGEQDLFDLNPDLDTVAQELPAYPRPSNQYTWKLGYLPYPQWTLECRLSSAYSLTAAATRFNLNTESYNSPLLLGFTVASVIFVSFLLLLIEIRRKMIRKREILRAQRLKDEEKHVKAVHEVLVPYSVNWGRNTWIMIIVDRFFQIIHIPMIFICYLQTQAALQWYNDITTNQCGDTWIQTNILNQYNSRITNMFGYYSTMLGLWWFVFIVDWAILVFRYVTEIKPSQDKEILIQQDNSHDQDDIQGGTPVDGFDESQIVQNHKSPDGGAQAESAIFDDEDHLEKQTIHKDPHDEMVVFDDDHSKQSPSQKDPQESIVNKRDIKPAGTGNSPIQKSVFDNNEEILP